MNAIVAATDSKVTRARFAIVAMLFVVTAVNYADRATLSLAGPALSKELGLDAVTMGYIFSAFGWSYVIGQLPGGWLLDRFGSKIVYFASIFIWSMFTLLQGGVSFLTATTGTAVVVLFALRFLVGRSGQAMPAIRREWLYLFRHIAKDRRDNESAQVRREEYPRLTRLMA